MGNRFFASDEGFTLVEMLAVLAIVGLMLMGAFSFYHSGITSWQRGVDRLDYQQSARISVETMVRELRYAQEVKVASPGEVHYYLDGDPNYYLYRLAGEELVWESKRGAFTLSHNKIALDITDLHFEKGEAGVVQITLTAGEGSEETVIATSVRPRNR